VVWVDSGLVVWGGLPDGCLTPDESVCATDRAFFLPAAAFTMCRKCRRREAGRVWAPYADGASDALELARRTDPRDPESH